MPPRRGVDQIADTPVIVMLRVMSAELLPLDVHGKLARSLADPFRRDLHTVGKDVSEAFPGCEFFHHRHHRPVVSPRHLYAVRISQTNQALLKAFDGEGHRSARGNSIYSIPVAQVVQLDDR